VGDLVVLETAGTEQGADLVCSILRNEGIECMARPTTFSAMTVSDGPHEVVVAAEDMARAREILELQRR
jgi:hypothetical protein